MEKLITFLFCASFVFGSTPYYFTFGLENGYDSNVLRFSSIEKDEAGMSPEIMGQNTTFDSNIIKGKISGKKALYLYKNVLTLSGDFGLSHYVQYQDKQYSSYQINASYKWKAYTKLSYSLRHLDSYYLRHYIDRDVSGDISAACLFSDREQKIGISLPVRGKMWVNVWAGYLQRYFDNPFTEFDLDIYYLRLKLNKQIRKFGNIRFQLEQGIAENITYEQTARASDFDRSYQYIQFYLPISKTKKNRWTDGYGFAIRSDFRFYEAENFGDPLHAGRNHVDIKLDYWVKKNLSESLSIKSTIRYRQRKTESQFEGVETLKSFEQWQVWCKLEWRMIYDRY